MDLPLNILLVEDSVSDAELVVAELKRSGFSSVWTRVDLEKDFLAGLDKKPDLVIADYFLPRFNGLRALEILQQSGSAIPFILISGVMGEDLAVEAMRRGATDYLVKGRIASLGKVVQRALREKQIASESSRAANEKRQIEERLRQSLETQAAVLNALPAHVALLDPEGVILTVNDAWRAPATANPLQGPDIGLGQNYPQICAQAGASSCPEGRAVAEGIEKVLRGGVKEFSVEYAHSSGTQTRWFQMIVTPPRETHSAGAVVMHVDITSRKHTEQALRESEEKFAKIFQSSLMATTVSTVDEGLYLDANREFLRMMQRTREDVIGHTSVELGIWADPAQRQEAMAKFKEHGSVRNLELTIRGRLGRVTHVLWSGETLVIDGRTCILGSSLDITGRVRAVEALRGSEEKYRKIFENVQDVFYQTDAAGKINEISPSILRYSGYSREELLGQPVENVYFNKEDRNKLLKILGERGEVADFELRLKTRGGRLVYTSVNAHILFDKTGQPCGVEGALRDITGRKLAEEELLGKTAFLEAQVHSAQDGILVVDNQGRQILQNERFVEIWKFPRHIAENSDDAAKLQFAISRIKNPAVFTEKVAYLNAHPDEVSRDEIELVDGGILDRNSWPVRDQAGKLYGRIWTFRDITEQRKLEMQFRQSQKMEAIGKLAGGVAHDFNNILAIIQLQAGLLKSEAGISARQIEISGEIEKATQRAANLTRQLLLFSQQQTTQKRDCNLNDSVTNMVKMLQRIMGEDVRMSVHLSAQPVFIHADTGMIDQILLNLAVNARDAMPVGGQFVIETTTTEFDESSVARTSQARPGQFACLSVNDTGSGIPPEILPRIFEPFFTTKDVGKGTGLGLATVFGIVQQHQGWINVSSKPRLGTGFKVYFPRLEKTPGKIAAIPAAPVSGGNETILVVEDDTILRLSVRTALKRLGYRVVEAADGADALRLWKQHRDEIRLVLTDLVMPHGMSGKELAEEIFKLEPNFNVIYTSGYSADIVGRGLVLEEGVNFIAKPYEVRRLAEIIRKRLGS